MNGYILLVKLQNVIFKIFSKNIIQLDTISIRNEVYKKKQLKLQFNHP